MHISILLSVHELLATACALGCVRNVRMFKDLIIEQKKMEKNVYLPVDTLESLLGKDPETLLNEYPLLKAKKQEVFGNEERVIKLTDSNAGTEETMRMQITLRSEVEFCCPSLKWFIPKLRQFLFNRKMVPLKDRFNNIDPKTCQPTVYPNLTDLIKKFKPPPTPVFAVP